LSMNGNEEDKDLVNILSNFCGARRLEPVHATFEDSLPNEGCKMGDFWLDVLFEEGAVNTADNFY
jgi:hypothetical protein